MIVCQDITILCQDEAGTGCGGCGLVAKVVGGDGGGDADGGVHVLRIDLARREYLAGVNGCDLQSRCLPLGLEHDGRIGGCLRCALRLGCRVFLHQRCRAEAGAAAHKRAGQKQRDDLPGLAALFLLLGHRSGRLRLCGKRLLLRVERLLEAVRVGIGGLLAGFRCKFVVVEYFRHIENLLSAHPCGACGPFVFVPSAYCTNLK